MKFPKLSNILLIKLSDICIDVGTVLLASVVLPAILGKFQLLSLFIGSGLAVVCWTLDLWLATLTKPLTS